MSPISTFRSRRNCPAMPHICSLSAAHSPIFSAPRSAWAHNRILRTAAEIAFRVRQEVANIRLWARPPAVSFESGWSPKFRAPDARVVASDLAGSEFAREVVHLAREIRAHGFPIFEGIID